MEDSLIPTAAPFVRRVVPYVVAVVIGGAGVGYAVHEHHAAQNLAAQNEQVTAQLNATHSQLDALTAKVNDLATRSETAPPQPVPAGTSTAKPHAATAPHPHAQDSRYKKLQSQVDAQGKEIEATRTDLVSTRTELTGSIARTHDELVVLEKKGERNYTEFDIQKSKQFQREGPLSVSLRKANTKHQYADLQLMVDDRNVTQKHVNLYQPVMFYVPDSPQPVEVVINDITKDHIHGYVSASKYRQSELTAAANADANAAPGSTQTANSNPPPAPRQKLPVPQ
ncbi:hypothetical protein H7849_12025 [Alloacidobacterium dinghuense]|uniref:Uncharacterized protein n=1 Tax=Alloacidobacterium dinghuense TaxID=2763107 RepID=A0A7G8BPT2_9BACT|nr:hypothetical protein [Alloacidobacterium dinghuense]QNI34552.1 hypothetical protein H7849_12025 [Alloacidobacterium dinghuense]